MKKLFLSLICACIIYSSLAQSTPGAAEKAMTDSICNCLVKIDLNKITNKQEATLAITNCFAQRTDLLMKVADEKHVDATDQVAMRQIGIEIGKDLLKQNCVAFTKLSVKMVQDQVRHDIEDEGLSTGIFKRIEVKGFNYIVMNDNGNEKSFIWLRQFPGSEKFMSGTTILANKKIRIKWHELEVYLPQAKGYYKIKEIMSVDFL